MAMMIVMMTPSDIRNVGVPVRRTYASSHVGCFRSAQLSPHNATQEQPAKDRWGWPHKRPRLQVSFVPPQSLQKAATWPAKVEGVEM